MAYLRRVLTRFRDETDGTITIESVFFLPLLISAILGVHVYFDAYRQASLNIKANYTVGDMLSRQTEYVTPAYLDTAHLLFERMIGSAGGSRLRISVVTWDGDNLEFKLNWSKTKGDVLPLTAEEAIALDERLPDIGPGQRLIIVETWDNYVPPFTIGLARQELYNFFFLQPRFAPQLAWSDTG